LAARLAGLFVTPAVAVRTAAAAFFTTFGRAAWTDSPTATRCLGVAEALRLGACARVALTAGVVDVLAAALGAAFAEARLAGALGFAGERLAVLGAVASAVGFLGLILDRLPFRLNNTDVEE